ncbi:hypothetical protein J1614_002922 [Plenodomus biglobosus]|nr:hypothetical protein J1614_002922 [Plenodomus biglobosus]
MIHHFGSATRMPQSPSYALNGAVRVASQSMNEATQTARWPSDIFFPSRIQCEPEADPWKLIVLSLGNRSLDGGGIRGLSSLYILQSLMEKIRDYEQLSPATDVENVGQGQEGLQLHDAEQLTGIGIATDTIQMYFRSHVSTLISSLGQVLAGTWHGPHGLILIAVMLGRLRMSITDCIHEYRALGTSIFGTRRYHRLTKYDHRNLESAIKEVVRKNSREHEGEDGNGEDLMRQYDFSHLEGRFKNNTCKVGVLAWREGERGQADIPHLFRSYDHVEVPPTDYSHYDPYELNPGRVQRDPTRIWQACRATSAAPLYFKKIRIMGIRYMDGGVGGGLNNPAERAMYESFQIARSTSGDGRIAAFISIGTGQSNAQSRFHSKSALEGKSTIFKGKCSLLKWARWSITDSSNVHDRVTETLVIREKTPYFRFDVKPTAKDSGLSHIKLDECKRSKPAPKRVQPVTITMDELGQSEVTAVSNPELTQGNEHLEAYSTYDIIERRTKKYCNQRGPSEANNIMKDLETTARILVYYRRRREKESPERWRLFKAHPYDTYKDKLNDVKAQEGV